MEFLLDYLNTETGGKKTVSEKVDWIKSTEVENFSFYIEGNYACDCCRGRVFGLELECGGDLIKIQIRTTDNKIIYSEFKK
jgi:hypothetical protein